jgi:uncharacterized protein YkwD
VFIRKMCRSLCFLILVSLGLTAAKVSKVPAEAAISAALPNSTCFDPNSAELDDAPELNPNEVSSEIPAGDASKYFNGYSDCGWAGKHVVALVNNYRAENGLPRIPLSCSLCTVANYKIQNGYGHDWTGRWACDFDSDWNCMWDKPRQLTGYNGNGYENWAGGSGSMSPSEAFRLWQGSSGHNTVMLNQGQWASRTWRAIGSAVYDGQAVLWFGEKSDYTSC